MGRVREPLDIADKDGGILGIEEEDGLDGGEVGLEGMKSGGRGDKLGGDSLLEIG